ncbi:MAG: hypothetical protein LC623_00525 [Halobacteriales archaeon]|nr:hypothetical protein [Halobacteriales archaeon]
MADEDLQVKVALDLSGFNQGVDGMKRGVRSFSDALTASMMSSARSVEEASRLFTRLDLAQISTTQSMDSMRAAQDRYSDAIARFGANSTQARKAAQDLERAHISLDKAQIRAEMSMGLVAVQSLQLATKAPAAVAALRALTAAEWNAATAAAAFANVVTLGAAAVGVVAGFTAIKSAMDGIGESTDRTTESLIAFNSAGADARLEATRLRLQQLKSEIEGLKDDIDFKGWGDWPNFGDNPKNREKLQSLYAEQSRLMSGLSGQEQGASDLHKHLADEWIATEQERRIETSGTLAEITARIVEYQRTVSEAKAKLVSPVDEKARADLSKTLDDAERHMDVLTRKAGQMNEAQSKSIIEQSKALQDSLSSGMNDFGVNLQKLSIATLTELSRIEGPLGALAGRLENVKGAEYSLAAEALKSSKALRDQTEITADKSEATSEFHKRLLDLGFTESDIAARVDATGRALRAQADATRDAASATASASSMPGANFRTREGVEYDGLTAFLEANKHNIVSLMTGFTAGSYSNNANASLFDGAAIADALMGRTAGNERGNPAQIFAGGPNTDARARLQDIIKSLVLANAPATQWDSLLKQAGVPGFAHGFDGIVRGPSLFLAGEHGAERVQVGRPGASDAKGTTVVFQPGSIIVNGAKADDLMRELRRLGVTA